MFKRLNKHCKGEGGLSPQEVVYAERMRIQRALSHERNFLRRDALAPDRLNPVVVEHKAPRVPMQNCSG